ncbi:MAG: porin family protein [Candidatus Kapaibacterium sp.]
MSLITFTPQTADAQQSNQGARIGANLANESYDSLPSGASIGMHTGFLAGGQFDYWFDDMWALSAQVLYDQKGAHEDFNESVSGFAATGTDDVTFNYLEIPILLKVSFGTGDFRPYVFAGPSFGIFLSGSGKVHSSSTFGGQTVTSDTTISVPDSEVKSPDIAAVFGAGVSLKLSSGSMLFFDAAYALGLTNIAKPPPGDNTVVKSRDIRLAVGILFPLD